MFQIGIFQSFGAVFIQWLSALAISFIFCGRWDFPLGCSWSSRASLVPSWSPLDHRCSPSSLALACGEEDIRELWQDDHQLADLAMVVGWIREYCGLEPPLCQNGPARGLKCSVKFHVLINRLPRFCCLCEHCGGYLEKSSIRSFPASIKP